MNSHLKGLEGRTPYEFRDKNLFTQALIHNSYANEHRLDHNRYNERSESLGDAVLEVVTGEFFYRKYETLSEEDSTKIRASIACEPALAYCVGDTELDQYLYLNKGEDATDGRNRNSVVSDTMEALVGIIYLGGGFANAREFIHRFILNDIEHKQLSYDSKTILQGMVQSRQEASLSYEIVREGGPDHDKSLEVCTKTGDEEVGRGAGRIKKAAKQVTVYNGILKLETREAATEE